MTQSTKWENKCLDKCITKYTLLTLHYKAQIIKNAPLIRFVLIEKLLYESSEHINCNEIRKVKVEILH